MSGAADVAAAAIAKQLEDIAQDPAGLKALLAKAQALQPPAKVVKKKKKEKAAVVADVSTDDAPTDEDDVVEVKRLKTDAKPSPLSKVVGRDVASQEGSDSEEDDVSSKYLIISVLEIGDGIAD
jgi:hypothetical protein